MNTSAAFGRVWKRLRWVLLALVILTVGYIIWIELFQKKDAGMEVENFVPPAGMVEVVSHEQGGQTAFFVPASTTQRY